jgi:hypothetical protein
MTAPPRFQHICIKFAAPPGDDPYAYIARTGRITNYPTLECTTVHLTDGEDSHGRSFRWSDYSGQEAAFRAANEYHKSTSERLGLTITINSYINEMTAGFFDGDGCVTIRGRFLSSG